MKNQTGQLGTHILLILGMALLGWVVFSLLGIFLIKVLFTLDVWSDPAALSNFADPDVVLANKVFLVFQHLGLFIFPSLMYFWYCKREGGMNYQFQPINWKTGLWILGLMVLFFPALQWLVQWNQNVSFPDFLSDLELSFRAMEESALYATERMASIDGKGGFALNLVIMAILPAVSEELLFRGALQPYFYRLWKNPHVAIWVSAILFSALHFQFFGFFPRLVLGAFFGYTYFYSGNLRIPILLHFANNLIALLSFSYLGMELEAADLSTTEIILSLLASGALVYLGFRWVKQQGVKFKV